MYFIFELLKKNYLFAFELNTSEASSFPGLDITLIDEIWAQLHVPLREVWTKVKQL